jgi:hypothetical protein
MVGLGFFVGGIFVGRTRGWSSTSVSAREVDANFESTDA